MIPIATMRAASARSDNGEYLVAGDKVFVVGYVTKRESPMAIVMHNKKGFHMVELWKLIPQGFRSTGATP